MNSYHARPGLVHRLWQPGCLPAPPARANNYLSRPDIAHRLWLLGSFVAQPTPAASFGQDDPWRDFRPWRRALRPGRPSPSFPLDFSLCSPGTKTAIATRAEQQGDDGSPPWPTKLSAPRRPRQTLRLDCLSFSARALSACARSAASRCRRALRLEPLGLGFTALPAPRRSRSWARSRSPVRPAPAARRCNSASASRRCIFGFACLALQPLSLRFGFVQGDRGWPGCSRLLADKSRARSITSLPRRLD